MNCKVSIILSRSRIEPCLAWTATRTISVFPYSSLIFSNALISSLSGVKDSIPMSDSTMPEKLIMMMLMSTIIPITVFGRLLTKLPNLPIIELLLLSERRSFLDFCFVFFLFFSFFPILSPPYGTGFFVRLRGI